MRNKSPIQTVAIFVATVMVGQIFSGLAHATVIIDDNFDTDTHDTFPAIQGGDVGSQWYQTHGGSPNAIRVIQNASAPAGANGTVVRQDTSFGTAYGEVETTSALAAAAAGQVVEVSYRMDLTVGASSAYHGFAVTPLAFADVSSGGGAGSDDDIFINAALSVNFYGDGEILYYSGGFLDPGVNFNPGEWNDIKLTIDFAAKTFDLSVTNTSGTVAATGLAFRDNSANTLRSLAVFHSGTVQTWIDDVYAEIIPIPEPASMILLTCGFAAVILRNRQ